MTGAQRGRAGPEPRAQGERGAGTVLLLGLVAVALLLALALSALGAARSARGSAQAAADLGALAGATALRDGFDACGTAAETVRRNGARQVACSTATDGSVAVAAARAADMAAWAGAGEATARARAGPRPP